MNEETVFIEALTKTSKSEQAAFLDEACAGNPQLRESVEELILAHDSVPDFLEVPILEARNTTDAKSDERTPARFAETPALDASSEEFADALDFLKPSMQPGVLGALGSYPVSEVIGRGGMGVVLRGRDPKLNRIVAIKVLAPELASNAQARRRFLREAQAAAAVSHAHVVTTHAIDEVEKLPYIVMEYVAGCSLQERIERDGPFDIERILRVARQTAQGLAAAHEQGLIHRDVKPANILLENGIERVKLSDFGLARAIDDVGMTQTGTVAGTPQYMSPEQAQGERVDHRSDLFSLGCVMYMMCTGRSPFRADTTVGALRRVCDDVPRPIAQVNSSIPAWLIAIIDRLLAKRPEDRFQSAAEVAEILGIGLAHIQEPTEATQAELESRVRHGSRTQVPGGPDDLTVLDSHRPTDIRPPLTRILHPTRRTVVACLLVGVLCMIVGVTEATGVSNVRGFLATVLRIGTPNGTLLLEVDDPDVIVTIDGEDVVITGAGPREVRLKPGVYRVLAQKDGKVISQELVTISRDGKEVVKIDFEPFPSRDLSVASPESDNAMPVQRFLEVARFSGEGGFQYSARFSPNGDAILIYTSAAAPARILHIPDGKELQTLDGEFRAAAFTPDGQHIVTGSGSARDALNRLMVWNVETGKRLAFEPSVRGAFLDLVVSSDGQQIVSGHGQWWGSYTDRDHSIRIWDAESRQLLREIEGSNDQVMDLAISPDGKSVVSGSRDRSVRLWNLETGEEIRRFEGAGTEVFSVAFSPNGRLVAGGYGPDPDAGIHGRIIDDPDHCVAVLWDIESGNEVQRFQGHSGCINSIGFSPDGTVLVTASGEAHVGEPLPDGGSKKSRDNTVRLWDVATGRQLAEIKHRTSLKSASFSPDGEYLLTSEWHLVHLWKVPDSLGPPEVDEFSDVLLRSPLLVSSDRDGQFDIYRVDPSSDPASDAHHDLGSSSQEWTNLTNHPAEDTGPAWSPDGKRIAFCSSRSGNLDIWLMNADGHGVRQVTQFPGIDRTPTWSPDGERIAFVRHLSNDNWEVFVVDADGSNPINLTNHPAKDADPAWSPDGKNIAYSFDGDGTRLYLMDSDGSNPRILSGRAGSFTYPAWSPDGSQILFTAWENDVGGNLELFVINADGSGERQLTQMRGLNSFAAWSPDGNWIAFEHRSPNIPGREATVHVRTIDGSKSTAISRAEAHVGFGGGRPAWRPTATALNP